MLRKAVFLSWILLCPCAFCYGQLTFLGVNGERGYSALRSNYVWDLDNNLILTPSYEFYRMSDDSEVERTGATYRYGLNASYDLSECWRVGAQSFWQPKAVGHQAVRYAAGFTWSPFYRYGWIKDPYLGAQLGQAHYKTWRDVGGSPLPHVYKQAETNLQLAAGAEVGPWNLKGSWQKVIQYNNRVRPDVSFSWADIPFMTAVVQGFVREAAACRVSYPTGVLDPYLVAARYQYAQTSHPAAAVGAGVRVGWEGTLFSCGIEVFEPRREEARKTFFSMSVEITF